MKNNIEINIRNVKKVRDMAYVGTDTFFTDKLLKQFKLRKQKTKTVYVIELKISGKFHREVIGDACFMTPVEARKKAVQLINDIKYNPVKPIVQNQVVEYEKKTLQDVFDDYLDKKKLSDSTIREYTRILRSDFGSWVSLPLKSITKSMIMDKFNEKSATAESEANHARRFLRAIFNFAEETYQVGDYLLIQNNPCNFSSIVPFNDEQPRDNRLDTKDLPKFWEATEVTIDDTPKMGQTKILCRILLLTGCREQEICSLKCKNVDLEHGVIYLEHTKNGNKHKIIYSKYVGELMVKLCEGLEAEDYLFPANTKSGHLQYHSKYMKKMREISGLNFSLHDLRRTFTSFGSTFCKIEAEMLEAMTNHKSKSVTFKHYVSAKADTFPVYRKKFQKVENYVMKHINK